MSESKEDLKTVKTLSRVHTGGHRAYGTRYSFVCPYCKYKYNTYSTVLNWNTAVVTCENCQRDLILENTDTDTQRKTTNHE